MRDQETGWTCYHCGEHFITNTHAKLHFGQPHSGAQPACLIKAEQGLVKYIRELEMRLGKAMEEDSDVLRELALQRCEKENAVQVAEELGYSRGLKDYTQATAQLEESQRRCAMLTDALTETKTLLVASMHEQRPWQEYEAEINALNDVINAISTYTEQWLQNEIARRLGEPVMYRNTSNGDVCESTDSLAEPLYSIAFIKP